MKLDAEKKRMDDLSTRDEANETKFAALQKTLDMLVNGETKKAMDSKWLSVCDSHTICRLPVM